MASEDKSTENYTLKNAAIDTAKTFVTHPMSLVKNSIQLGHEPLPAFAGKTWFFKDAQFHVGLVPYGAEIYRKYGVVGLFRGVTPKVGSLLAYNFSRPLITRQVNNFFPNDNLEINIEKDDVDEVAIKISKKCLRQSIIDCLSITLAHPLYVMAVRSMAQYVGGEEAYNHFLGGFLEIKDNEGLAGFFKGLVPKLLGAITSIWLIEVGSYGIKKLAQIARNSTDQEQLEANAQSDWDSMLDNISKFSPFIASSCLSSYWYRFNLVSVIMATQGSRLAAATQHQNWNSCYNDLAKTKQLNRGSSIIFARKVVELAAFSLMFRQN